MEESLILMVGMKYVRFVGLWDRAQMEANAASVLAPLTVVLPSFISASGTRFWVGPDGTSSRLQFQYWFTFTPQTELLRVFLLHVE